MNEALKGFWNEASLHRTVDYEMENPKQNSTVFQRLTSEESQGGKALPFYNYT